MERVTFLNPFGAPKAPQFFFIFHFLSPPLKAAVAQMGAAGSLSGAPMAPQIFFFLSPPPKAAVAQMGAAGPPTGAPSAPLLRRAREFPPKAGVRQYVSNLFFCFLTYFFYYF